MTDEFANCGFFECSIGDQWSTSGFSLISVMRRVGAVVATATQPIVDKKGLIE